MTDFTQTFNVDIPSEMPADEAWDRANFRPHKVVLEMWQDNEVIKTRHKAPISRPLMNKILDLLAQHRAGYSISEIGRALGITFECASTNASQLADDGAITRRDVGREVVYMAQRKAA